MSKQTKQSQTVSPIPKHKKRRGKGCCLLTLLVPVLALAFGYLWYFQRPLPANRHRTPFPDVEYIREVRRQEPRLIAHILKVPLGSPKHRFFVTPPEDPKAELPLAAQTTTQFLQKYKLQAAVNADAFYPWWSRSLFNYYPHVGDRSATQGISASQGTVYVFPPKRKRELYPTLYFSQDNRAQFFKPQGKIYNAISGMFMLINKGDLPKVTAVSEPYFYRQRDPRSAIGIDREGKTLIIVVVDGRQPNYSEGATLSELTEIMVRHGIYYGMNLDGGGSSALVVEGKNGQPLTLNSPIDCRIPGRQRAIANHLGVFIEK